MQKYKKNFKRKHFFEKKSFVIIPLLFKHTFSRLIFCHQHLPVFLTSAKVLQGIVAIHIDVSYTILPVRRSVLSKNTQGWSLLTALQLSTFSGILSTKSGKDTLVSRTPTATRYSATVRIWIPYSPSVAL